MKTRLKFKFNGAKLKDLRIQRGLSRPDLAKLLNSDSDLKVTDKAIANWENGHSNPSFEVVREMSYRFGIKDDNYWKSDASSKKKASKDKGTKQDDKPLGIYVGIKSDIKGLEEISAELDEKISKLEKLVAMYSENAKHLENIVGKYKKDMDDGFYRLGTRNVELNKHIEAVEELCKDRSSSSEDFADFAACFMLKTADLIAKGKLQ